jgi:hypothetical protein
MLPLFHFRLPLRRFSVVHFTIFLPFILAAHQHSKQQLHIIEIQTGKVGSWLGVVFV